MTKRKSLLTVLSGLSIACLAGAFTFLPVSQASAEETQKTVVENVLMEGAYVRTTGEGNETYNTLSGIRFVMFIDQETYTTAVETYGQENVEVGMYYVGRNIDVGGTIDVTTDEEMQDINSIPKGARHAVMEAYTDSSAKTESASMAFSVAQLGIPESGYNAQLIANGYLKTTDSEGNETYTWATNPTTRSVAEMASIALAQGATHADLHTFVNAVATEDTFKFANDVVETDMYKATDLGLIAPANLQVVWDSSNEDVATFDENGALVKVGEGTTTITASIGNNVREMTLNIVAPKIVTVNENTHAAINNTNVARTYIANGEGSEIEGFKGAYKGNAKRFQGKWANDDFIIANPYTLEQLNAIKEDYNMVTIWVAANNIASGSISLLSKDQNQAPLLTGLQDSTSAISGFTTASCGTWYQIEIPIESFISLATDTDGVTAKTTLPFTYTYPTSLASTDDDTNHIYFYVGDIGFAKRTYVFKPNSSSIANHEAFLTDGSGYSYTVSTSYQAYSSADFTSFTGNYTGGAIKMGVTAWAPQPAHAANYTFANPYTTEQLDAYKADGYTHVSMWFAFNGIESGSIGFKASTSTNFVSEAGMVGTTLTSANNGVWYNVSITIEQYKSIIYTRTSNEVEKSYVRMWHLVNNGLADGDDEDTTYSAYAYLGAVELVKGEYTHVAKMDELTHNTIYNTATTMNFVSAEELATLNIAANANGESWTGNAKCFRLGGALTNAGYRFINPYTAEELESLKSQYNTVTIWVAATGITGGSLNINALENYFGTAAGMKGFGLTPTWQKLSISLEDYIAIMEANSYADAGLFATAKWSNIEYTDICIYVSDMYFEYVEVTP